MMAKIIILEQLKKKTNWKKNSGKNVLLFFLQMTSKVFKTHLNVEVQKYLLLSNFEKANNIFYCFYRAANKKKTKARL